MTRGARDRASPAGQVGRSCAARRARYLQAHNRLRHPYRRRRLSLRGFDHGHRLHARNPQPFCDVMWQALGARLEMRADTQGKTSLEGFALRRVQRMTGFVFHNVIPRE